ncbi:MAG: hypothetical protein Q8880_06270 [Bacteroidota bacterium]|nr:hypothetical protein [Bacteroidota bacterium]
MKKIFLLMLAMIVANILSAQNSGYLGKKFTIYSDLLLSKNITEPNRFESKAIYAFNDRYKISGDYVLGRNFSAGLSMEYFSTCFKFSKGFNIDVTNTDYNNIYSSSYSYYIGSLSDVDNTFFGKLNVLSYGAHVNFFLFDDIAPLGRYIGFELMSMNYNVNYDKNKFKNTINNILDPQGQLSYTYDLNNKTSYNTLAFLINVGQQRIFNNNILFRTSIQTGLVFGGYSLIDDEKLKWADYFDQIPKSRLASLVVLSFNIGIGYVF